MLVALSVATVLFSYLGEGHNQDYTLGTELQNHLIYLLSIPLLS